MTKILIKTVKAKAGSMEYSEKSGILSGKVGIVCNLILVIIKLLAGSITGSVSVTADAMNNLSDCASNIVTIAGSKLSAKPRDKEHPFGHGRLVYISALVVSAIIFLMGFELAKTSVGKIIHPSEVKLSLLSTVILIISVCIKLWMAYFNNRLYKVSNNINLKAVGTDSLNDCIATGATMLSLIISHFTKFYRIDGIIGLCVAGIVFWSGVDMVRDILGPLLGQPPSKQLVDEIESIIMEEDTIKGVHDLIVHDYGPGRKIASAHAEVPSDGNIVTVHDAIDRAESNVEKRLGITMCIHMDPIYTNDIQYEKYKADAERIIKKYNEKYSCHDFRVVDYDGKIQLIFDLVIPFEEKESSDRILKELLELFEAYDSNVRPNIKIEHSYT